MLLSNKQLTVTILFSCILFFTAIIFGAALGMSIAVNKNTSDLDELLASRPALPSRILDINGDLITEFFSDEKREITPIKKLPENLIFAILTREDSPFFKHTGFSIIGFIRALYQTTRYIITSKGSLQGASTITMQLAGSRYADRSEISLNRKLKEIWWAYQLERRFTKQEILEQYLNTVYFGHNTYGVETASQFFFGHSAVDNTPAESVMLAIQLVGSGLYSPLINPDRARNRQYEILKQMSGAGYINPDDAESSFKDYWDNFDWSRSPTDSPYLSRLNLDKAPWFSEYIRSTINQYLFGQQDIYRDGYNIYTTLDLSFQTKADQFVNEGLERWNRIYQNDRKLKTGYESQEIGKNIDLLSLVFNLPEFHVGRSQDRKKAEFYFTNDLTPTLDMMAMTFGVTELKSLMQKSYQQVRSLTQMNNVETALITIDNRTGHILAMIGGSEFNRNNQFNRAMSANVMPGSAFKPLYYAEAISSGKYTPSSLLYDGPELFTSPDGTPYTPGNYFGKWHGDVLLRDALALSLNIPALKIFRGIGFDAAIKTASKLLGIKDSTEIAQTFDRVYPLGLGTLSVTPVKLARAYATFANRGRAVEPLAIRYVEDRDGNIIVNPERELREKQERENLQIISPQAAYIMSSLLQSTVNKGTLSYANRSVGGFDGMPIAGKTGTTQNWTDAWTIGFSPYYTTVIWIGFDKRGNSLGMNQTGATSTGPVWAKYMKAIHENLPRTTFPRPESGIVERKIDLRSGMLPQENTPEDYIKTEIFIAGTQPKSVGEKVKFEEERNIAQVIKIAVDSSNLNLDQATESVKNTRDLFEELGLDSDLLYESSTIEEEDDSFSLTTDILD